MFVLRQVFTHSFTRRLHISKLRCRKLEFNMYDGYRDPAPLFIQNDVQTILKRITGMDMEKVVKLFHNKESSTVPSYKLLTKEAYEEMTERKDLKAKKLLQMPPVVKVRSPIKGILSKDPEIQGFTEATYIFTDITEGVSDRERIIVARDPDGTLRHATWEERDHCNQIYNPKAFVKLTLPRIFLDENLIKVLDEEEYEHVLNLACLQFDADNPVYQEIVSKTYEALDAKEAYNKLHSTRHFGPMCFYLAWYKKMDNLLIYILNKERLMDAVDMVKLYHLIHPESKSINADQADPFSFIKAYADEDSQKQSFVQLALQTCIEMTSQRALENLEDIKKEQTYYAV